MSEDSTTRTLELGNGVRLILPLGWQVEGLSISLQRPSSIIDHRFMEYISIGLGRSIAGETLSTFSANGSEGVSYGTSTGPSSTPTLK